MTRVAFAQTQNRPEGVAAVLKALEHNPAKGKDVLLKPNFNTADAPPASTHNDTLLALVDQLWAMGAKSITLGERSHPPTAEVMEKKGVLPLLAAKEVQIIDFDTLPESDWVLHEPAGSHWSEGFRVARPIMESECLVSTCCLKTHQFGGVFTLSLKLHVGVVPTYRHGFQYMQELHNSEYQQEMIAEINAPYAPALVLLDGVDAFVDGGPASGTHKPGNVMLAATDRVAIDAVGVAVLKRLGSNDTIMGTPIFEHKQIKRAADLGLGAASAGDIELYPVDPQSQAECAALVEILAHQ